MQIFLGTTNYIFNLLIYCMILFMIKTWHVVKYTIKIVSVLGIWKLI